MCGFLVLASTSVPQPAADMTKRFERSISSCDGIKQNLKDWGIADSSQYRDALRGRLTGALEGFERLRDYIKQESRPELVLDFQRATTHREKLTALLDMPVADAVNCLRHEPYGIRAINYLARRLEYYQSKMPTEEQLSAQGSYAYYSPKSYFTADGIRTGLRRDILLAAMYGRPELAALTLAGQWCEQKGVPTVHMPQLTGTYSGITSSSIGVYQELLDIYTQATVAVGKKQGLDPASPLVEHRAVLLMARWLTKSMEYNCAARSGGSSYVAPISEAVAWARLGEGVQRQLRGMRQRINAVDLHNTKRFIGKSGNNRYEREIKIIHRDLTILENESSQPHLRDEVLKRVCSLELATLQKKFQREEQRLSSALDRSIRSIEKLNLAEEEEALQLESAKSRFSNQLSELQRALQDRERYLQSRSYEQVEGDLQARLETLVDKAEKHKSLAQKALDLHFHFKDVCDSVDWINTASFGQISRAHRMLSEGVSDGVIIALTVADWQSALNTELRAYPLRLSSVLFASELSTAAIKLGLPSNPDKSDETREALHELLEEELTLYAEQNPERSIPPLSSILRLSERASTRELSTEEASTEEASPGEASAEESSTEKSATWLRQEVVYLLKRAGAASQTSSSGQQADHNEADGDGEPSSRHEDFAISFTCLAKLVGIDITSEAMQKAAAVVLGKHLERADFAKGSILSRAFSLPRERDESGSQRLQISVHKAFEKRDGYRMRTLAARLKRKPAQLLSEEPLRSKVLKQVHGYIDAGNFKELSKLKSLFSIPTADLCEQQISGLALRAAIKAELLRGIENLDTAKAISFCGREPKKLFKRALLEAATHAHLERLPVAGDLESLLESLGGSCHHITVRILRHHLGEPTYGTVKYVHKIVDLLESRPLKDTSVLRDPTIHSALKKAVFLCLRDWDVETCQWNLEVAFRLMELTDLPATDRDEICVTGASYHLERCIFSQSRLLYKPLEYLDDVRRILDFSKYVDEQLRFGLAKHSGTLQQRVLEVTDSLISTSNLTALRKLKDMFCLSDEELQASNGFEKAVRSGLNNLLAAPVAVDLENFRTLAGIPEDMFQQRVFFAYCDALLSRNHEHAAELSTVCYASISEATKERLIESCLHAQLCNYHSGGAMPDIAALTRVFPVEANKVEHSSEIRVSVERALCDRLVRGNLADAQAFMTEFIVTKDELDTLRPAVLVGVATLIETDAVHSVRPLCELFGVTETEIQENADVQSSYIKQLRSHLTNGHFAKVKNMLDTLDLGGEYITSVKQREDIYLAGGEGYEQCLIDGAFSDASSIRDFVGLNEEDCQRGAKEACQKVLISGAVDRFNEILKFCSIDDNKAKQIIPQAVTAIMMQEDSSMLEVIQARLDIAPGTLWSCVEVVASNHETSNGHIQSLLCLVRKLSGADVPFFIKHEVKSRLRYLIRGFPANLGFSARTEDPGKTSAQICLLEISLLEAAAQIDHKEFTSEPKTQDILSESIRDTICKCPLTAYEELRVWAGQSPETYRKLALSAIESLAKTAFTPNGGPGFAAMHYASRIEKIAALKKLESLTDVEFAAAIGSGLAAQLSSSNDTEAADPSYDEFVTSLRIPASNTTYLPQALHMLCSNFGLHTCDQLRDFKKLHPAYFSLVASNLERTPLLTAELIKVAESLYLRWDEAEVLLQNGVDLKDCLARKDFKSIYTGLCTHAKAWLDADNVALPFKEGAEIFGYQTMLEYGSRPGLSRHDAYFAFKQIISLYAQSELPAKQFAHNILRQVLKDRSTSYREGTAHHHLNSIAQGLGQGLSDTLEQAQRFNSISKLADLTRQLSTVSQICSSWGRLKRFQELRQLLGRTQLLKRLSNLRAAGTHSKLCDYVEALAFSDSQVNMDAAIQFALDPSTFLAASDGHSDREVHSRKKPSNYTIIPHLGLTAEQLRDALVEGVLDQLQVFSALEIHYQIPRDGEIEELHNIPTQSVRDLLREALGSRKAGIQGKARDVKKLFHACKQLLAGNQISISEYLEGKEIETTLEQPLLDLIKDKTIGVGEASTTRNKDLVSVIAKINLKSDPDGVLAGNDTACCMPFGSGKNTVYTFNPNCAHFTVQIVNENDKERTIAQSVLTRDRDIEIPIPQVIAGLSSSKSLDEVIPESLLFKSQEYLACDNVEVAPNFKSGPWPKILEFIYRDFFSEYMRLFAQSQRLNPHVIPIGMGNSDALDHLTTHPNTFAPVAPVAYSDKTGTHVYALSLSDEIQIPNREIVESVHVTGAKEQTHEQISVSGVSLLNFTDTLQVAYLESRAYSTNPSLITYLHNIENELIAKDISNAAKERPNLSIKYTDAKGQTRGYIIAYEGEYSSQQGFADLTDGARVIYISDIATAADSPLAAGKLLYAFGELYQRHYLETGELVPIYAGLREQTSYRLLKRKLEKLAARFGCTVEMREFSPYHEGRDRMYPVVIQLAPLPKNAAELLLVGN